MMRESVRMILFLVDLKRFLITAEVWLAPILDAWLLTTEEQAYNLGMLLFVFWDEHDNFATLPYPPIEPYNFHLAVIEHRL